MKKKFLKVSIVAILLILVYATIVNALSFTVTMTPSSTNVNASNEFTVQIKIANLDVGEKGINTISGTLDYDEDVFEVISESSFDKTNAWNPTYNSDTKKITLIKGTFVKAEEQVLSITFKTKSDVEDGTVGQIKFTDIVASNSESDISASDTSTSITVGQESNTNTANVKNTENLLITPTNNAKPANNTVENTNHVAVPSYVNYVNETQDNMPHTGAEDTIIYFIGATVILAIVFYIKFESVNKELK